MSALLFLISAAALGSILRGNRTLALVLFAVAACGTLAWFEHHRTSPLALVF